eukprot:Hpha_TRINITY_DN16971_c1_g1::TRINITY_DN16971_c1_g1_i10::g.54710::m.54710
MEPAVLLEEQLRTHAQQVAELQAAGEGQVEKVKIAFISDTHNGHRSFAEKWPECFDDSIDVLIHGGDATNEGADWEFAAFNAWLGELQTQFPKLRGRTYWVTGNHDVHTATHRREISIRALEGDSYFTTRVRNAILLHHGNKCEVAPGLWAAGVPWCPWHNGAYPDNGDFRKPFQEIIWKHFSTTFEKPHRYDEIPKGVEILVQHMPIGGIFDRIAPSGGRWGSSHALREVVESRVVPSAVFHGHLHEQNGCFARASDGSWGAGPGVCYPPPGLASDKVREVKCPLPEPSFGVGVGSLMQMIVNGANSNLPGYDGHHKHICMPPRFILARRVSRADGTKGKWIFSLATH